MRLRLNLSGTDRRRLANWGKTGAGGFNAKQLLQTMNPGRQLPDLLNQLLEFRLRYHFFRKIPQLEA